MSSTGNSASGLSVAAGSANTTSTTSMSPSHFYLPPGLLEDVDLMKTIDELIEDASLNTWPSDISEMSDLIIPEEGEEGEEDSIDYHQFFQIGTKVLYEESTSEKDVKVLYKGQIENFDAQDGFYYVRFQDDEVAEYTFEEISKMILHP
jgi:hypothetical protein